MTKAVNARRLTSLELFTGAGGLALGISRAKFRHLALIERDRNAIASLLANKEGVREMRDWPVMKEPTELAEFDFSPFTSRVNLLAAGAPCQPFSLGGKHRGAADSRNLFPQVLEAVRVVRPEAVLIENVKGLRRSAFAQYLEYIRKALSSPSIPRKEDEGWKQHSGRLRGNGERRSSKGYTVKVALLNAADYGIPQMRERVFIVGLRNSVRQTWEVPKKTHSRDALLYEQWVSGTYWSEHDLPQPAVPRRHLAKVEKLKRLRRSQIPGIRWQTVRDAIQGLPTPLASAEPGPFHNHKLNPGARTYPGHTGSALDWPAKTIKAGAHGVPGGENVLIDSHSNPRYFTVREAARLQGFPDEYVFSGAWCEGFRQLGNAVPVGLAATVARSVAAVLTKQGRPPQLR